MQLALNSYKFNCWVVSWLEIIFMTKEEIIKLLDRCIPFINKRGETVISWILEEQVHESNLTASYEITTFLIEEGFADLFDSVVINMLKQSKPATSRTIVLTYNGIKLVEYGSYRKYNEYIISEKGKVEALQIEAVQMAHRQYKINVWIAIGTLVAGFGAIVAAVYYLTQLIDYAHVHYLERIGLFYFVTGLGVGLLYWLLSALIKMLLLSKPKQESK